MAKCRCGVFGGCVAGRADEADDVAARDVLTVFQTVGVALEVRVVVTEALARIVFVDRVAATAFAEEQLRDGAALDGVHRRISRRQNVHRLVRPVAVLSAIGELSLERWPRPRRRSGRADRDGATHRSPTLLRSSRRFSRRPGCRRASPLARDADASLAATAVRRTRRMTAKRPSHPEADRGARDQRRCDRAAAAPCALHLKTTGVPFVTSDATRATSQFVNRTQPCDAAWPTRPGSGVPCSP